ncbi:MAG: GNAT family N-acetyltransferase [Polyangiaceae bacterium]|nr:GNAT family N-acetyltransferase [Polyangiaceae bacterium]
MSDERIRPTRIRVSRLQEVQVEALVEVERACAAMYHDLGFDAAEVPVRTFADIAHLPRYHNVYVAEADHEVAGYVAWRDESPGVAYIEELSVHPQFQRFGVGSKLLATVEEDAVRAGLADVVAKKVDKAAWATAFYAHHGFTEIGAGASAKAQGWVDERSGGRPLTRPGEVVIWKRLRAQ